MTRIKKSMVFAAAFVGLFAGSARAQDTVVAKVPFPFVVRGEEFPAGHYEIRLDAIGIVWIRGADNGSAIVAITSPADGRDPLGDQPSLVFTRYENAYRLSQIWDADTRGRALDERNTASRSARTLEPSHEPTAVIAADWK